MWLILSATAQPLPVRDPGENQLIEVGPLQISPSDHIARAWGHALMLSGKELNLLTELAKGDPEARLTREAKASLERLSGRDAGARHG